MRHGGPRGQEGRCRAGAVPGGSGYTLGEAARASAAVADDDEDNPGIVTKKAIAREGTDEAVVFTVLVHRARAASDKGPDNAGPGTR